MVTHMNVTLFNGIPTLYVNVGETIIIPFTVNNFNMTGYNLKSSFGFPLPIGRYTASTGGGQISTPTWNAGLMVTTFTLTIPTSVTDNWPSGEVPWDFWMIDPSNNETPWWTSKANIISTVSPVP